MSRRSSGSAAQRELRTLDGRGKEMMSGAHVTPPCCAERYCCNHRKVLCGSAVGQEAVIRFPLSAVRRSFFVLPDAAGPRTADGGRRMAI